jgi:hypothetical protein
MTSDPSRDRAIVLTPRLLWAFGSIAAIIAGSLGPWITLGAISVSGTGDGRDGTITLIVGIAAAVLVVIERGRVAVGVLAAISLAVAVIDGIQVLRSREETLLGSIEIGWGLIVLALGAAGLLAWAITEYARAGASRRVRSWAWSGIAVALIGTTAALAASGRFDAVDQGDDGTASSESVVAKPKPKPKATCDALGINAAKRQEGDCVAENGWPVRVVNDDSELRLDSIAVRLVDINVADSLRDITGDAVQPDGQFVKLKLEVRNDTNSPIDVSSDSFVLSAAETTNEPDTDAILDDALGGESIGPGLAATGYLVFDVAPKAATAIATDANLVVFDPADEGAPQEPSKRVGFIRIYTRPDAGRSGASESSGVGVAPDAGVDQTAAAEDGSYSYQEAIRSPSGRIKCAISRGPDGHRVECTMDEAPTASGETNWWRLDDTGSATRFRRTVFQGEANEMPYGKTYYFYGGTAKLQGDDTILRCTMRESGITCQNREGHGFKLAAGVHETF